MRTVPTKPVIFN